MLDVICFLPPCATHPSDVVTAGPLARSNGWVAGRDALDALGDGQRQFTRDHPGLWAATQLPVAGWSEASQKTADAYLALVLAVLRGYGATGDQAIHAARFIRASLRGFIDLELGGGFGLSQDVDASFRTLLHLLDAGLRSLTLQ